jgi:hypothetical protein
MLWQKTLVGLSSTEGLDKVVYFPDPYVRPFALTVATYSASNTYNVEHTVDATAGSSAFISSNATWFLNSTQASANSNLISNYAFGVGAIRLNVTAGSTSNAGVTMKILQAG